MRRESRPTTNGRADPVRMLEVRVKPNARMSALEECANGQWQAQLKSPPVDGRANAELIALVARHFDVPKSAVEIRLGAGGRTKLVRISGPA